MNTDTYEDWMRRVDKCVEAIAGVSVYDLPDYCFRDAYEDGRRPSSVARDALKEAGW